MAHVFTRQHTEQGSARPAGPGNLEVDQRGAAIGSDKPIRFLCQIVMHDAPTVEYGKEAQSFGEIRPVSRLGLLHGRAGNVATK